jgi:hypothetical protein
VNLGDAVAADVYREGLAERGDEPPATTRLATRIGAYR